ncbi:ribonuclease H family protein [Flaviflexus massiliensis]|uniref:ribonuclease H family protein n=1 Tax=Flaviflexus massiliensis TaxID=1522309 RepID=UPI0009EA1869|nr:ribonuclease H [Flaviflexus massiliensis]
MTRTDWLATSDLALACGTDPHTIIRHLSQLGLVGAGSAASDMALRHDLAITDGDYASEQSLWHPDVITLLAATGLERVEDRNGVGDDLLDDGALFDEELVTLSPIERARSRAQNAPATAPDNVVPAGSDFPVAAKQSGTDGDGPYVPGADKYGFDQVIATDGACSGNPGRGGWAWVDELTGTTGSGGSRRTTNNIMELTAMLEALRYADNDRSLLLRADSQYVINVVTKWGPGWRRKGWKKADGKPVANQQLVADLLEAYEARTAKTRIDWVRGHDGDAGNEEADRLAVIERDRA